MTNTNALKSLFKPHIVHKPNFAELITNKIGEKKFWKIQFEQECSKAIDESCINTECRYNYLNMHKYELYVELMQEIQAERRAVEERTKRDMEKYYGKKQ